MMYFLNKFRGDSFISALSIVASFFVGSGLLYGIFDKFVSMLINGNIGGAFNHLVFYSFCVSFVVFTLFFYTVEFKFKLTNEIFKILLSIFGGICFISFFSICFYFSGFLIYDAFAKQYGLGGILFSCGASIFCFIGSGYFAVFLVKSYLTMGETISFMEKARENDKKKSP